ncbi:hypothetical protein CEXT_315721, partial [Caerostris extrusa]
IRICHEELPSEKNHDNAIQGMNNLRNLHEVVETIYFRRLLSSLILAVVELSGSSLKTAERGNQSFPN